MQPSRNNRIGTIAFFAVVIAIPVVLALWLGSRNGVGPIVAAIIVVLATVAILLVYRRSAAATARRHQLVESRHPEAFVFDLAFTPTTIRMDHLRGDHLRIDDLGASATVAAAADGLHFYSSKGSPRVEPWEKVETITVEGGSSDVLAYRPEIRILRADGWSYQGSVVAEKLRLRNPGELKELVGLLSTLHLASKKK